jgi:hypothetical protein
MTMTSSLYNLISDKHLLSIDYIRLMILVMMIMMIMIIVMIIVIIT